jgi:hypothetical protein
VLAPLRLRPRPLQGAELPRRRPWLARALLRLASNLSTISEAPPAPLEAASLA